MEGAVGRVMHFFDATSVAIGATMLQKEIELFSITELGFDQEFSQVKEGNNTPRQKLSLIQLATEKSAYLFHVHSLEVMPEPLLKIMKNDRIVKIGLGLNQDYHVLYAAFGVQVSYLDLQLILQLVYKRTYSLQDAVSMLCSYKITKKHSGSNWAWEGPIDDSKKRYAAEDAFACLDLWKAIKAKLEDLPTPPLPIVTSQAHLTISDKQFEEEICMAVKWFTRFPTPRDVIAAEKQLLNSYKAWINYPLELKGRLCKAAAERVICGTQNVVEATKTSSRVSPPKSIQKKRDSGSSESSGSDKELSSKDVPETDMITAKQFLAQFHLKEELKKREAIINQITNSASGLSIKHFPSSSIEKRRNYATVLVAAMVEHGYLRADGGYVALTKKP